MFKKVGAILILMLTSILLAACNSKQGNTSYRVEVRIIEDFATRGLNLPSYFHLDWRGDSLQVLNGLTGEVEKIIEFNEYQRFSQFPQPFGDFYIIPVELLDSLYEDIAQVIATEYFIFDQDFNLVEEFVILSNEGTFDIISRIGSSTARIVGKNEIGEWLGYGVSWDHHHIYAYNFNTSEILPIAHLNGFIGEIHLMAEANKLAFVLRQGISRDGSAEFGFIDLETFEVDIVHKSENVIWPTIVNWWQPVPPTGEFLLVNMSADRETQPEREVFLLQPLTGEVRTFTFREDDYFWRGDENYFRWINDANITLDGKWLLMQDFEWSGELVEGWSASNITSRVRLYDAQTSELVFEHLLVDVDTLDLGEELMNNANIIQIEENIYLIRESISIGRTEQSPSPLGIRFEYIFVEIVVNADE